MVKICNQKNHQVKVHKLNGALNTNIIEMWLGGGIMKFIQGVKRLKKVWQNYFNICNIQCILHAYLSTL